jgi:nicotinamidase-related amidase
MRVKLLFAISWAIFLAASVYAAEGPNRPEAKPVALDAKSTAILVLDLNARCHDAKQICNQLTPRLGEFLERARGANVLIVYSVSAAAKGTPLGEVASPLKRREGEPVVYPDAFDKFTGGELESLLKDKGIKTVVITGASTNAAVLYTATTAARMHRYNVVVPMDGMVANTNYEQEYTFHQFTVLPSDASKQFQFTKLDMVGFK